MNLGRANCEWSASHVGFLEFAESQMALNTCQDEPWAVGTSREAIVRPVYRPRPLGERVAGSRPISNPLNELSDVLGSALETAIAETPLIDLLPRALWILDRVVRGRTKLLKPPRVVSSLSCCTIPS